jgi:hypothetical protein
MPFSLEIGGAKKFYFHMVAGFLPEQEVSEISSEDGLQVVQLNA